VRSRSEGCLGRTAERCEVVQVEDIKPSGDVLAVGLCRFLITVHPLPLIDGGGGATIHEIRPGFDFLPASTVFLIFFNPFEDFTVAESACELLFEAERIYSGKFQKILVQRAVVGIFPIFFGEGGATFIKDPGENHITTETDAGASRGLLGKIGSRNFCHRERMH